MTSPVDLKCPQCGAPLSMEDVNVAANVALCRTCSHIARFSDLVQEEQDDAVLDSVPARMKVMKTARGLEVTYKHSKGMGAFFLFFALFWNGITYSVLFSVLNKVSSSEGEVFDKLFFIPFILVGAGTLLAAVYLLFGRMTLTLKPGSGELFRGVGDIGRRQKFLLARDARISIEESSIRQNNRVLYMIVVSQPEGKPFEFGTGIAEGETQRYVAALLRQMRA